MSEAHLTPAMLEYLAGCWKLENRGQEMTTRALATYLGVSDTAVSRMTKRLLDVGLVTHLPHQEIGLTTVGRRAGGRLVRHHRLLEVFLIQALGFTWDQVDVEAHRLEHGVSEVVGDRIEEVLGFPTHCPHGDPIPGRDGTVQTVQTYRLSEAPPGQAHLLRRVGNSGDASLLRYLAELKLRPGARVTVQERAPFKGPLHLTVNGEPQVIGYEVAALIWVATDTE